MASSSSWLNICLFYSHFGVYTRNCPAVCRRSCGKHSCFCYTVSYTVLESIQCPGPYVYFSGRWQTSFTPVIVWFLSCTMKGTVPFHHLGKTVQIHKDFVWMRKSSCVFGFTSSLWWEPAQKSTKHDSGVLVLWKHFHTLFFAPQDILTNNLHFTFLQL